MAVTTVSIALGTFMAICAATSIILNLLVIYTIVLGGFLRARENSIYILSLLNLVIDCAHATFVFVYLVPSSIAQVWGFCLGGNFEGIWEFFGVFAWNEDIFVGKRIRGNFIVKKAGNDNFQNYLIFKIYPKYAKISSTRKILELANRSKLVGSWSSCRCLLFSNLLVRVGIDSNFDDF
jgi:hypothetical protein